MDVSHKAELSLQLLDILPNPVLVKDQDLKYIWINRAFEELFSVKREEVIGKLDTELFPDRQVSQCNGGDLRVLNDGEIDEASETVFEKSGLKRQTITRKSRLVLSENETYLVGIMHDITDVTRANEALITSQNKLEEQAIELARLANTDTLTGCLNRRSLEACEKTLLQHTGTSVALLTIDLDKFKSVNDNWGHECGDMVLKHFANLVSNCLSDDDYFIRLGGEEFVVVLNNSDGDASENKANEIRELIGNTPVLFQGNSHKITVSIGIANKPAGETALMDDMLRGADKCLYAAKNNGRNQVIRAA